MREEPKMVDIAMWDLWGGYIAVIMSLATLSITLLRDNPAGEVAQRFFMTGSWANFMILSISKIQGVCIQPILAGDIIKIIPLLMGLLFVTLYYRPSRHLSRFPTAIIAGVSMGLAFRGLLDTQLVGQVQANMLPLTGVDAATAVQNLWIIVTSVLTIFYFTFSFGLKEGSPMYWLRRLGRYTIMLLFGIGLGAAPWSSTALIAGRMIFILQKIGIM
jgi:hypothetical protein